jgi:hypothetical protein
MNIILFSFYKQNVFIMESEKTQVYTEKKI